jgi:SPP1 gp7 family putative phage head morphogenesis protein
MTAIDDALKEKRSVAQLIKDEVKKYEKNLETFYRTQTKSAREFGYAKNDKTLSKEVKGWISVAVLDNKTSAICVRLHNTFYSKERYATRFDIPFQIPRHPNCRSTFVTVFKGRSIQSYKGKNINTFLNNNPTQGEAILGIEKYRLFKEGKKKITSFIDIKGRKFYTNAEIKKRLGIK